MRTWALENFHKIAIAEGDIKLQKYIERRIEQSPMGVHYGQKTNDKRDFREKSLKLCRNS